MNVQIVGWDVQERRRLQMPTWLQVVGSLGQIQKKCLVNLVFNFEKINIILSSKYLYFTIWSNPAKRRRDFGDATVSICEKGCKAPHTSEILSHDGFIVHLFPVCFISPNLSYIQIAW